MPRKSNEIFLRAVRRAGGKSMKITPASVTVAALALAFLAAPLGNAQPQTGTELSQAQPIVEGFFSKLREGKLDEAFEYLASQNPAAAAKRDEIEKARAQFLGGVRLLGEYRGHERLVEKAVGTRFVHVTYFLYFDRQPLRLTIELYKPKDAWLVHSFNFDDQFLKELRDAAGRKYLE